MELSIFSAATALIAAAALTWLVLRFSSERRKPRPGPWTPPANAIRNNHRQGGYSPA